MLIDEIIKKKEEVLADLETKSNQELEENYREMAKEYIDTSIFKDSLFICIMELFGEEKAFDILKESEHIYEQLRTQEIAKPAKKALTERLLNNNGDRYLVDEVDLTIKAQLKINNTLKDFQTLTNKQIGAIYENIASACIKNDEFSTALGMAIENQYGEEIHLKCANFTVELFNEQKPKEYILDLTEEDVKNFERMLAD